MGGGVEGRGVVGRGVAAVDGGVVGRGRNPAGTASLVSKSLQRCQVELGKNNLLIIVDGLLVGE